MLLLCAAARESNSSGRTDVTLRTDCSKTERTDVAMVTITLMGQLQTTDGERDLACELSTPLTVRQVIQRQGRGLRHMLQLLREKKVLVTINKRIASEDSLVQDGDAVRFVGHDGAGGSGLAPSF